MKVIAGCVVLKDHKILMVKEAGPDCYGKWNFPGGKLEEFEKITDGALRETFEETGCKVNLKGVLAIAQVNLKKESHFLIRFVADVLEENICFDKDEILDVQWIEIEDIKKMSEQELRGYEITTKVIEEIENDKYYPLDIIDNMIYNP